MYSSCRSDSSTTTHAATAAADTETGGYSYGYTFNNIPSSQCLFHTPFPSPIQNQKLSAAAGVDAGVIGGVSDHRRGVYLMDPHLTCLKLGKKQNLDKCYEMGSKKGKKLCSGGGVLGASPETAAAKCQVDGCEATLVREKEYHRRHKVCEVHAKAAAVVVLGVDQRFCQQCSRFHQVSEFDESKRSCRSRLAGHNKRRRKTSNDSITTVSHGPIAASPWHAPSLLSSTNAQSIVLPSDISSRSSAALRELIDEHRATTVLAGIHHDSNYWPPRFERQGERQVTLDLMQLPRLVTNGIINGNAKEEEPCFGIWNNSFL